MIAWSSYVATYAGNGRLQFYATPTAAEVYNKEYVAFGFGSNISALGQCRRQITSSFNSLSATLSVNIQLCDNPPCEDNPCPGILAPQATGCVPSIIFDKSFLDTFHAQTY